MGCIAAFQELSKVLWIRSFHVTPLTGILFFLHVHLDIHLRTYPHQHIHDLSVCIIIIITLTSLKLFINVINKFLQVWRMKRIFFNFFISLPVPATLHIPFLVASVLITATSTPNLFFLAMTWVWWKSLNELSLFLKPVPTLQLTFCPSFVLMLLRPL